LLLETSKSATWALDDIKKTANDFVKQLRPQDRTMIVSFDRYTMALCELTSDLITLERAIGAGQIGERFGPKLRDAVTAIMKEEYRKVKGRKPIVLLIDGKDYGSGVSEQALLESAAEADTLIYAVFYRSSPGLDSDRQSPRGSWGIPVRRQRRAARIEERNEEATEFLRRSSEVSAGRYSSSEVSDLKQTFGQIVEELRHQYRLGFYQPDDPAGSTHTIKVEIGIEGARPEVVVRSRRIYRVAGEPQSE
jgi:VWFA-related protein